MFASLVTCTYSVNAESADSIHFSSGVTLFSPLNRTYNSRYLSLNFSFIVGLGIKYSLNYDIDGKYGGSMPYVIENPEELHVTYFATGLVKLPELSEGSHSLTVNLLASPSSNHIKPSYADTVYFSIDLTPPNISIDLTPPNILILSPENRTYIAANVTTANIPLNFTLSEQTSKVSYSLDRHNNATIAGNMTLSDLSIGSHNFTIYARDVAGNTGASETIYFTIEEETELPEPFSTTLVVASVITVAIVDIGIVVYFKKRKR